MFSTISIRNFLARFFERNAPRSLRDIVAELNQDAPENPTEGDPAIDRNPSRSCHTQDSKSSLSILVVCQYFYPENFGINSVAAELALLGHEVEVLTGMPNYPSGVFADGYGGWRLRRETYKNVEVIRVPILARGRNSRLRLALNYLSYAFNASVLAPFVVRKRPDVILIYQLSPVMIAIPALIMKLFTGAKIVLWVQDVWPDSLVATGTITNRSIIGIVRGLVRLVYHYSSIIAVQSNQFIDFIRPMTSAAKSIRYLPNTAEDFYKPLEVAHDAPERSLFKRGFNFLFAGNMGIAQDLEAILNTLIRLKERKDIQWTFVGQGRLRGWFEAKILELGLADTVQFLDPLPPQQMPVLFAIADVLLISLRQETVFSLTVPSRLQSYIACRRPILAAVSGEAANILTTAGAGLVVPPRRPEELANAAVKMAEMSRAQLNAMAEFWIRISPTRVQSQSHAQTFGGLAAGGGRSDFTIPVMA